MKQQSAGKQTPSSSGIPSNGSSATHLTGIATPQWRAPARGSRGEWARGSASPRPPPSELASVCRWSAALGAERSGTGGGRRLFSLLGGRRSRTHGGLAVRFPSHLQSARAQYAHKVTGPNGPMNHISRLLLLCCKSISSSLPYFTWHILCFANF